MLSLTFKQYASLAYTLIIALGFTTFYLGYLAKNIKSRFSSSALLYGSTLILLIFGKYTLFHFSTFYLIHLSEISFLLAILLNDFILVKDRVQQKFRRFIYLIAFATIIAIQFTPLSLFLSKFDATFIEQIHLSALILLLVVLVLRKAEGAFVALWAINAIATLFIIFSMNPFGLETFIALRLIFFLIWINQTWKAIEREYDGKLKKARQIEKNFDDVVRREVKERLFYMELSKERIANIARTDDLTGSLNKKTLLDTIDKLIIDKRTHVFSVLMFDIDSFKTINDTHGHITGDKCLKKMAFFARESIRDDDKIGRYGGDEFVIVLPGATIKTAAIVAERFRRNVEKSEDPHFTVSIGIASYPENGKSVKSLIAHADAGLYMSKQSGKNRTSYKIIDNKKATSEEKPAS